MVDGDSDRLAAIFDLPESIFDDGRADLRDVGYRLGVALILVTSAGITWVIEEFWKPLAKAVEQAFAFAADITRQTNIMGQDAFTVAWETAAEFFPIAGPLDFALGVLLLAAFFVTIEWMWRWIRRVW